jgi:hypothetical protein
MEKAPPSKPQGKILLNEKGQSEQHLCLNKDSHVSINILVYIPSKTKHEAQARTCSQIHIIASHTNST